MRKVEEVMEAYCVNCMRQVQKGQICPHCGDVPEQEPECNILPPGTILQGRYMLGNKLGQGGFGITYIGCDLRLNLRVAIKEYFPNGFASRNVSYSPHVDIHTPKLSPTNRDGKEKFLAEARVLAQFHEEEGIVKVRDFFEENNTAYIVMDYLDGITMQAYLKQHTMQPAQMLQKMEPILHSLEKIHEESVIHRDISPDNIMMLHTGPLKLMDFGAAKEIDFKDNKSISVVLKQGFAPIEQYYSTGVIGPWTDIYALCATMYMCLTGKKPKGSLDRQMDDDDQDPFLWPSQMGVKIDPQLEAVLKKGMAIDRKKRYQSVAELRTDLKKIKLSDGPPGPPKPPKPPKPINWKKLVAAAAAVVVVAAIAVAAMSLGKQEPAAKPVETPAYLEMMADARSVLQEQEISGTIVSMSVEEEEIHEKYGMYEATCLVKLAESEEDVTVRLIYKQEEGQWVLDPLSKIQ